MIRRFIEFLIFFSLFTGSASAAPDISATLSILEKKINELVEDKARLSVEKTQLESQVGELQAKVKNKKIQILKRLKAVNSLRSFKWGELLFSNNLNALERNLKILKNLNKYDYELFKEFSATLKFLSSGQKNLIETELLIQKNVDALKAQQEEFLKLEAVHLASLNKMKKISLLTSKGYLSRPLEGLLKQEFGSVRDQNNQFYMVNYGELYTATKNAPVKSVGLGTIIFRDELLRWRETVVVQHDDNYYSVYAGLANVKKSVGDRVMKNELIGATKSEVLYFELRHFDSPINPKFWYHKE